MKYTNILHFMNDFRLFYPMPIPYSSYVVLYSYFMRTNETSRRVC